MVDRIAPGERIALECRKDCVDGVVLREVDQCMQARGCGGIPISIVVRARIDGGGAPVEDRARP
jgi:hypothetical protein